MMFKSFNPAEAKSRCVYVMTFSYSSQSSVVVPGRLSLLLQLNIQHAHISVHGILFWRQLHLSSHPRLHPHFIKCKTTFGAGGFKHLTGEKWLEPALHTHLPNQTHLVLEGTGDLHHLLQNHGCVMCPTNVRIQRTRSKGKVFSFCCTI